MRRSIITTAVLSLFLLTTTVSRADIKLKVAVVNPSQTEVQTTPVRYDLPKGLTPSDITDIGPMELKYDFEKGNYYLSRVVKLKPAEKLIMEIKLKDIWMVPQKEIDFLINHTKFLTAQLQNDKHYKVGSILAQKITLRLDAIAKKQADQNLTITEHINLYYENLGILDEVREDIGMLENLVVDVGGIVKERVRVPVTLAVPIRGDEKNQAKLVEVVVKASNPSKTAQQSASVKYILPEEVTPRYVVDRGDLEMGYDFAKQAFYVYKDNVALKPSEIRNFTVKITDIWQISDVETEALKAHTDNLMLLLNGTEYLSQAKPIEDKIIRDLNEIKSVQALKVSADEHIAYYRKNKLLLDDAKQSAGQLEKLVSQSGASAGVTIREAEVQKGGGPKEKRARGYEGIDYIVKSIFRGKAPTAATTWKIIFGILIFVGMLSALFFWLWYSQVKRSEKKDV
jgi:hypothetical protein